MNDEFFLFPLSMVVHHASPTSPRYRIVDQRVIQRNLFCCLREYLLHGDDGTEMWAAEADIWPLDTEE